MKGLLIAAVSVFFVSVIFRLLHWPGASLMTMIATCLVFIFAIINSIVKKKVFNINILGGWVLFFWGMYIFFKYLYWYAGPSFAGFNSMFLIVFILTVIYIAVTISNQYKRLSKVVVTTSIIGITFSFIPSYSICYFFDLNEVINKEYNQTNYYSWDKYSWFLYIRGEKNRALESNQKAINALNKSVEIDYINDFDHSTYLVILNSHRQGIIDGTWTESYIRY